MKRNKLLVGGVVLIASVMMLLWPLEIPYHVHTSGIVLLEHEWALSRMQNRGVFRNTIEIAKLDLMASKIAARQAGEELQRRLMSAFLEHKSALRKYQALQQQQLAISEEFRYAQKSWKLGSINSAELSLTRTRLVDAQSALLQAKYDCLFRQMILNFMQGNPLAY